MRTISVELPDDLFAQFERAAKARRVTKSGLVRETIKNRLWEQLPAGNVSCYDLACYLPGSLKSQPEDLAGNQKHMGGFGG